MKKYLLQIIIVLLGLVIVVAIVVRRPKIESNKQEVISSSQEIHEKTTEKITLTPELQTDKIPSEWKVHLPEIKEMLFKDISETSKDDIWYNIVMSINNPLNKSFSDITGDGIPELMIPKATRPAGGTCFNVLRLYNNKVKFVTKIDPLDYRLVEIPLEGCSIGNGRYGSNFYFEDKYKAIIDINFEQNDGEHGSSCNAAVWLWNLEKQEVVYDSGMSAIVSDEKCSSLDDFLNGR